MLKLFEEVANRIKIIFCSVLFTLEHADIQLIAVALSVERLLIVLAGYCRVVCLFQDRQLRQCARQLLLLVEIIAAATTTALLLVLRALARNTSQSYRLVVFLRAFVMLVLLHDAECGTEVFLLVQEMRELCEELMTKRIFS